MEQNLILCQTVFQASGKANKKLIQAEVYLYLCIFETVIFSSSLIQQYINFGR